MIWSKFFWSDWRGDPALRACTVAARGFWMELLCIAAEADPTGYVLINGRTPSTTDLARLTGAPEADVQSWLEELDRNGVFSRDKHGRIYSRRIARDEKRARTAQNNGRKGGNPNLRKEREIPPWDKGVVNPGDKPQKLEARSQKLEVDSDTPSHPPNTEAVARAAARDPTTPFFWQGTIVRITRRQFDDWVKNLPSLGETGIRRELMRADSHYAGKPAMKPSELFFKVSTWLAKEDERVERADREAERERKANDINESW